MSREDKPVIAVTLGEPAGIGPEVVLQAITDQNIERKARLCVIGEKKAVLAAGRILGREIKINETKDPQASAYTPGTITMINTNLLAEPLKWGKISRKGGAASYETIKQANDLAMRGRVDAIATAPIHKESLKAAEVPYIDHTSMLTGFTNSKDVMTMFATGNLRILFLTKHISLREVADAMTVELIQSGISSSIKGLKLLGIKMPKLAVAALNPHGGEHGLFGTEEDDTIRPAIEDFMDKKTGEAIDAIISGPVSADAVFHQCKEGVYDAVLSLYHDQGHIAAKTLDFHGTVSFALGLPYLRTSVDHGTAFDIAGKGKANPRGMKEAILAAIKYGRPYRENKS